MVSAADTAQLRQAQQGLRKLVEAELRNLVDVRPSRGIVGLRNELLRSIPALVEYYGEAAATVAADWYENVRDAENIPAKQRFHSELIIPDRFKETEGTVRRAAGALFTDDPEAFLRSVNGPISRYVIDASRATVIENTHRDPQARGWQRITRAGSCDFCRMLAGRGSVYVARTAQFAAHNDCNCAAAPSWDPTAPEADVRQYEASERTARMDEEQKQAHRERIRSAIEVFTA